MYECTQIRVNYKVLDVIEFDNETVSEDDEVAVVELDTGQKSVAAAAAAGASSKTVSDNAQSKHRRERAIREYEYVDSYDHLHRESYKSADGLEFMVTKFFHEYRNWIVHRGFNCFFSSPIVLFYLQSGVSRSARFARRPIG